MKDQVANLYEEWKKKPKRASLLVTEDKIVVTMEGEVAGDFPISQERGKLTVLAEVFATLYDVCGVRTFTIHETDVEVN